MPLSRNRRDALLDAIFLLVDAFVEVAIESGAEPIAAAVAARLDSAVMRSGVPRVAGTEPASPYLTQREAAKYTRRSISSLRRARSAGLPHALVGGNVVFERAVLDAWMRGEKLAGAVLARLDGGTTPDGQPPGRGPPATGER